MKTKLGILLMVMGVLAMLFSGVMFYRNHQEQTSAMESQHQILPHLVQSINTAVEQHNTSNSPDTPAAPPALLEVPKEMTITKIDGYDYVGFLSIPALKIELSVMADWSYPKLQKSPCRYSGNVHADDLVISAHNYWSHFGQLKNLKPGDSILFTDMDGTQHTYQVIAMDILDPYAVEEMVAGDYDLTLFTCTYGGQNRVTIRCDRIEQ